MTGNVTCSSGNVFKDIGVRDPGEAKVKAHLAFIIDTLIQRNNLTQEDAAKKMGVDQPKVSNVIRGKLSGVSIESLFGYMVALGSDIDIVVSEHQGNTRGHVRVDAGALQANC